MMESVPARTAVFGAFELDLRAMELRKNGVRIKVQKKPLQVLELLLASPGAVVRREEIRKLWPAGTHVEFDHSIGTAVGKLRQALGDSADHPRFIETIRSRPGFRFIAELKGSGPKAIRQLPSLARDFTGRKAEMDELMAAAEKGGVVLCGMAGVGKTVLALKLAEALELRYPDAQLYLDLKGATPQPLTPAEAMARVIQSYEPAAFQRGLSERRKLSRIEAELGGRYRSVLNGQRAILLIDNAKDAAQIQPLTPPATCILLVTSRRRLVLPGLDTKSLEALPPADARKLLLTIAPRIGGEAEAMAKLCGYLPFTLRAAGSFVKQNISITPADYVRQLARARRRLELTDPSCNASIEASLSLSYKLLGSKAQHQFRSLAVFPETFDAAGAAAVWGCEPDPAQDALATLVTYSLVEYNLATARYSLHDLVRLFADARLTPSERNLAQRRHAEHYRDIAARSDDVYLKGRDTAVQGLRLFRVEWENIRAGQAWAAGRASQDDAAARLCSSYSDAAEACLEALMGSSRADLWHEAALAAAKRLGDRVAECSHLDALGFAHAERGRTSHRSQLPQA